MKTSNHAPKFLFSREYLVNLSVSDVALRISISETTPWELLKMIHVRAVRKLEDLNVFN